MRTADLELVERCQQGNAEAFEELYREHAGRLYSLVFRMTGSAEEAEDLLQDVFLHAHRKLGSFRGESSLGTWLYRLGMNRCLDYLRGRQVKMGRATDSLENAIERAVVPGTTPMILPEDLVETILDSRQASTPSRFHDAVRQAKREVIIKAFEQSGGSHAGAAQALALHPNYLHRLIGTLGLKSELKA